MLKSIKRLARQCAKDIVLWGILPAVYRHAVKRCDKPDKVLFIARRGPSLPSDFSLIYQRTRNAGLPVRLISLGYGTVSHPALVANYCKAATEIARAKTVFINDASELVSCLPLRPETRVVQLWHACGAFKKWGMSTASLQFGGSTEEKRRHPFYENLSLVTISSPEVSWAYAEAMDLVGRDEPIKALGVSRTDIYFDQPFLRKAREKLEAAIPACAGKKVLLYAPTFRGRANCATGPNELDLELLQKTLAKDWVLLVKHHPYVKKRPKIPAAARDFAFDVSGLLPINVFLSTADACITDYSSTIFEYSLFEKPLIFFDFDKADYDDWRGFYYDYEELTPGPTFSETAGIADYLLHLDTRFDKSRIVAFRKRFMSACDGHATDRILEEIGLRF